MSIKEIFKPLFGYKKSALFIKNGKQLLSPHNKTIKAIQSAVGLQDKYWNYFYLKTLQNLAEFVQELPASEAHHHSGSGGLLQHTLDTSLNAIRIRLGKLLPPNADAETVTKFKDVWTYAIFTGALTHDLAKPITDIDVALFDKDKKSLGYWQPFNTSMRSVMKSKGATTYKLNYRRSRIYATHERASAFYLHNIIPPEGLQWIASHQELFYYWINLITGHHEDTGIIGNIIHEADKLSVASNLAGDQIDTPNQAASTSRKPLYQRIVTSLRYQIDAGHLPLNRDGAAGWIKDDKLWIVVKRALDQVRDHMTLEGQTGIPSRNDRIMDELQQYGVLIPNRDKAVWKCQVFDDNWPKAHELTLLCLPVVKIWAAADAVPKDFKGRITPLDSTNVESVQSEPEVVRQQLSPIPTIEPIDTAAMGSPSDATTITEYQDTILSPAVKRPTPPRPDRNTPPTIDFSDVPIPAPVHIQTVQTTEENVPVSQSEPVVAQPVKQSSKPEGNPVEPGSEISSSGNVGEDFLKWLRDGLHQRSFKVNDVNSRIHMTQEGLLLVSPAIFKQFDKGKWSYAQKRFTKLKLHERNANGTNIHEYLATGKKKRSLIKGFLITDTANVFPGIELPNTNHVLSRVTDE